LGLGSTSASLSATSIAPSRLRGPESLRSSTNLTRSLDQRDGRSTLLPGLPRRVQSVFSSKSSSLALRGSSMLPARHRPNRLVRSVSLKRSLSSDATRSSAGFCPRRHAYLLSVRRRTFRLLVMHMSFVTLAYQVREISREFNRHSKSMFGGLLVFLKPRYFQPLRPLVGSTRLRKSGSSEPRQPIASSYRLSPIPRLSGNSNASGSVALPRSSRPLSFRIPPSSHRSSRRKTLRYTAITT
jgi:hypothetical protein